MKGNTIFRVGFVRTRSEANCPNWLWIAAAAALWMSIPAKPVGFRVPNQDPEAIARGNAFAATADNPAAIYYNPAGITQLKGNQLQAGLYLITVNTEYRSSAGARGKTDSDFQYVPQLHYVYSPKDLPVSFGLGIYAPYGLALKWTGDTRFRTLAEEGKILYATVNPVVAWQVHPTLSLAVGPTLNYSTARLRQGIGLTPNDEFKFHGDGFAPGFNAGLFWHPVEQWALGVNYRYTTTISYDGHSEAEPYAAATATSGEVRFPQYVVVGVSYRPTPLWNLEADIDWTDWDHVNAIVFHGTTGGDRVFPLNYRSSLMYELGVTRQLPKNFHASVGYIYSENSIPDANFNPIVPDANLHLGSVGVGWVGAHWNWALAYHFAYSGGREVMNSQSTSLIGETADGTYKVFNHAVTMSATWKF